MSSHKPSASSVVERLKAWFDSLGSSKGRPSIAATRAALERVKRELKRKQDELDDLNVGPLPPTEHERLEAKISFLDEALTAALAEKDDLAICLREQTDAHVAKSMALGEAQAELANLREMFESVCRLTWDCEEIDGGYWQDEAERRGLLVLVPADDEFRAAWDQDCMYTWSWSPLAIVAAMQQPASDGDGEVEK